MRRLLCFCLAAFFILVGYGWVQAGSNETAPAITASGPDTMDKKAVVVITGTGFLPGQEINLLFTAKDGMQSDIGYALKEPPKADSRGTWQTDWACYDFIHRKMVRAGKSYKLTTTDSQYQPMPELREEIGRQKTL